MFQSISLIHFVINRDFMDFRGFFYHCIKKQEKSAVVDDDEYEILDNPAAVPIYATVRTSGHNRKRKEIDETLKEDDYYEFIQQVREVRHDNVADRGSISPTV